MNYSALLSVYSKENPQYFNQALWSIYKQTEQPTEIIIVKDGPLTEELDNVIQKFSSVFNKNHIKYITLENKCNRGLGYSLNRGLKSCSEDLVARFDSDDINSIDRMSKTLKVFKNISSVSVVGGAIDEFSENIEESLDKREVPVTNEEIRNMSKSRNPMNHMSVTLKKADVLKVNGYEDIPYFEDYYLWMKLISNGYMLLNIPDVLVHARTNNSFYQRRTGLAYLRKEVNFQYKLFKNHMLTFPYFIRNIIFRGGLRLLSPRYIAFVYKILRK
ncbi:glycosyltransferase [Levilactobacillus parabrevis]|uniref:glycosyltransferase n=1 Tax=Levilactobacillus parabrevis TaxID=357278 RepID=UPI0021A4CAD6|nr:glycosyltransferase [Levilactobacillus parabrevis]MCT4490912.1 glycosyltransferase [Levilactobacillus parabrevis]